MYTLSVLCFKQKTAYEMRISDWSSDVCSSDLLAQVIERVSGPGSSANAGAVLVRAPQLVQRYGFDQDDGGALQLVASFDRNAVDSQLRAAGLPVWGVSSAPAPNADLVVSGLRSRPDSARPLSAPPAGPRRRQIRV